MTAPKSPEQILADYTEDLLAERPPRLAEDVAALDEASRLEVLRLAALVRAVKAAKAEVPGPSPEFLARLDERVAAEIDQLSAKEVADPTWLAAAPAPGERANRLHPQPDRPRPRPWRDVLLGFVAAWRWKLVGCAVAAILLLQGHLFLQIRGLQEENRSLLQRVERLGPVERLAPMQLRLEQEKRPTGTAPLVQVQSGAGLRPLIEQRIQDLERESAAKTGEDQKAIARAIQELRQLLQAAQAK